MNEILIISIIYLYPHSYFHIVKLVTTICMSNLVANSYNLTTGSHKLVHLVSNSYRLVACSSLYNINVNLQDERTPVKASSNVKLIQHCDSLMQGWG